MSGSKRGVGDRQREAKAAYSRAASSSAREVGPLPPVKDAGRKNAGLDSLEAFCRSYLPMWFPLPFCAAHRDAIGRLESCTNDGGLYAQAMMRGGGKTTLARAAALRAILYGLRRFVVLIQATQPLAVKSLKVIQRQLEANDLLAEDFPEACYPIRALERIHHRAGGQMLDGEPTRMEWTTEGIVLPTVRGSASSGVIVHVAGITGAIKGLNVGGPNGEPVRPDLVLLDDCQTRESSKSPTQTADREAIIVEDVLGLSGPDTTIAAVHLCTPIYPNDLAERFIDRQRHPDWRGVRTRMLAVMPARMDLWDRYAEVRRESGAGAASEFYVANGEAMQTGAVVTWPERRKAGPFEGIDGLELAMILLCVNPRGFRAEYQCEPEAADLGSGAKELHASELAGRLSGTERYLVPRECTRLTAGIDCGAKLLWYVVTAWTETGGGCVIDYGCWPRQARSQFDAADARPALADRHPGLGESQLVFAGLRDLTAEVLGRTYFREGGGEVTMEKALVDSGWQTAAIYQFVRQSPHVGLLLPSKGIGRTTVGRGVGEWKPRPGERVGHHWRLGVSEKGRGRSVQFDPDPWKTLLWERLTTPPGAGTALTFHGRSAGTHAMLSEHLAAEYSVPATLRGQTFDKWTIRPDRPDNHLLDALVLSAVAASVLGLRLETATATGRPAEVPKGPAMKLSEIQARRRESIPAGGGPAKMKLSDIQSRNRAAKSER